MATSLAAGILAPRLRNCAAAIAALVSPSRRSPQHRPLPNCSVARGSLALRDSTGIACVHAVLPGLPLRTSYMVADETTGRPSWSTRGTTSEYLADAERADHPRGSSAPTSTPTSCRPPGTGGTHRGMDRQQHPPAEYPSGNWLTGADRPRDIVLEIMEPGAHLNPSAHPRLSTPTTRSPTVLTGCALHRRRGPPRPARLAQLPQNSAGCCTTRCSTSSWGSTTTCRSSPRGAGSACGKPVHRALVHVGEQRRANYACRPWTETFVSWSPQASRPLPPTSPTTRSSTASGEVLDIDTLVVALSADDFLAQRAAGQWSWTPGTRRSTDRPSAPARSTSRERLDSRRP